MGEGGEEGGLGGEAGSPGGKDSPTCTSHYCSPSLSFPPLLNLAPAAGGGAGAGGQRPVPFLSSDDTMLHPLPLLLNISRQFPIRDSWQASAKLLQPFAHLPTIPPSTSQPLSSQLDSGREGRGSQTSKISKSTGLFRLPRLPTAVK